MSSKINKICKKCKSENVVDAWASWNIKTQQYDLCHTVFEQEYCNNCKGETTIINKKI